MNAKTMDPNGSTFLKYIVMRGFYCNTAILVLVIELGDLFRSQFVWWIGSSHIFVGWLLANRSFLDVVQLSWTSEGLCEFVTPCRIFFGLLDLFTFHIAIKFRIFRYVLAVVLKSDLWKDVRTDGPYWSENSPVRLKFSCLVTSSLNNAGITDAGPRLDEMGDVRDHSNTWFHRLGDVKMQFWVRNRLININSIDMNKLHLRNWARDTLIVSLDWTGEQRNVVEFL